MDSFVDENMNSLTVVLLGKAANSKQKKNNTRQGTRKYKHILVYSRIVIRCQRVCHEDELFLFLSALKSTRCLLQYPAFYQYRKISAPTIIYKKTLPALLALNVRSQMIETSSVTVR